MPVKVQATNVDLTDALQTYVERRVLFALGRFHGTLRPISVRISKITREMRIAFYACEVRTTLLRGKGVVDRGRSAPVRRNRPRGRLHGANGRTGPGARVAVGQHKPRGT